jgi:hypothetical protein
MTDTIVIRRWDTGAVIYVGPRDGLAGHNLYCANLSGANLSGANLRGVDLRSADLRLADLRGADLFRAGLFDTKLSGAKLSDANLSGTNLCRANLSGANLSDAKFCTKDGKLCTLRDVWQAGPLGSRRATLTVFATDRGLMVETGCFRHAPVDDFLAAVEETHGDNRHGRAYRAAIECARVALEVYAP